MIENSPLLKASRQKPAASGQKSETRYQTPDAGKRPFIVPVFLPHAGCPHRCVFCNQAKISGRPSTLTRKNARHQIDKFLGFRHNRRGGVQIAFYGGNFLGIQKDAIKRLLTLAAEYVAAGQADSIRFSTRPDTIDHHRLALIKDFPVSTVELGVQSMNDSVLKSSNRGHTVTDTTNAVQRLKEFDYEIGVQLMIGLPDDNAERALASAHLVAGLKPHFARIYPTVVLADSPLEARYKRDDYVPLSLEAAVVQAKALYLVFKNENIPVIRMGLQETEDFTGNSAIVAGPYHPAFGHLVYSEVFLDKAMSAIKSANLKRNSVGLHVHSRSVSKMRGLKNRNIKTLRENFDLQAVEIFPDDALEEDQLIVKALF